MHRGCISCVLSRILEVGISIVSVSVEGMGMGIEGEGEGHAFAAAQVRANRGCQGHEFGAKVRVSLEQG